MAITKEEFRELIEPEARIEKISTLSSDGTNLLTRVPKDIQEDLDMKKGQKIRWLIKEGKEGNKEIIIRLENGS